MRADPRLARVPVVLLSSAFVEEPDRRLAREVGANALLSRTPDMHDAIDTLETALRQGGPMPLALPAGELAALHAERLQAQLEKQVVRNEALIRQGAVQAAALSVVRGLALALASPRDVATVLADVLVHCLDAAGLSTGALYLLAPGGELRLRAQAGLPSAALKQAAECFGRADLLQSALARGEPSAHVFASEDDPRLRQLGRELGRTSGLIVPFLANGEPVGVLILAAESQDLSEPAWMGFARALAEQFGQTIALGRHLARGVASEARYRTLMEEANDAILLVDLRAIVEVNQQAEVLLGRPRSEIVGRTYEEFVVPAERDGMAAIRAALLDGRKIRTPSRHLLRADGTSVPVEATGSMVQVDEEALAMLILRDVTERERAERELRLSEERYRLLFESNPHPMWVDDPATLAFLAVNEAAVQLYGFAREEFLAMSMTDILAPGEGPLVTQAAPHEDALQARRTWKHRRRDGSVLDVEVVSSAIVLGGTPARLVLATDVSERKGLEAQLLQAQKMEAVGRLAGGVAHDFNNLLGIISGHGALLRRALDPLHPAQRRVEQILDAATRAAGLTRQLLAFSRKQLLEPKVLNLNEVVAQAEKMLVRLIGEDVQVVTRLADGLGRLRADPTQMDQIILNLVVNARDAMPRGGHVILETANVVLDEAYVRAHAALPPGPYVMLAVSDTGQGMDAETQAHIFEPFFTTKEEGKGTGLGLATVFGIVKQSGGHINVYSEPGLGSTFRIYFPRVDEQPAQPQPSSAPRSFAGTESILLVEDAEPLRSLIREILESAGYRVIEAADPQEALKVAESHAGPIRLLLTDVVMPRGSGPELSVRLGALRGEMRTLYMSGYTDEALGQRGVLAEGTRLLQKPFSAEVLLKNVRERIDGP
jgi:PAS domain S-box-containing protein